MVALPPIHHGWACLEPSTVVKSHLVCGCLVLLVSWKGLTSSESSRIDLEEFQKTYPKFQLEDYL
jgi:hypothetical protein